MAVLSPSGVHEAYKISPNRFGCAGCEKTYLKISSAKDHANAENGIK